MSEAYEVVINFMTKECAEFAAQKCREKIAPFVEVRKVNPDARPE